MYSDCRFVFSFSSRDTPPSRELATQDLLKLYYQAKIKSRCLVTSCQSKWSIKCMRMLYSKSGFCSGFILWTDRREGRTATPCSLSQSLLKMNLLSPSPTICHSCQPCRVQVPGLPLTVIFLFFSLQSTFARTYFLRLSIPLPPSGGGRARGTACALGAAVPCRVTIKLRLRTSRVSQIAAERDVGGACPLRRSR